MLVSGKVRLKHRLVHINFRIKNFRFLHIHFDFYAKLSIFDMGCLKPPEQMGGIRDIKYGSMSFGMGNWIF